jgi:uncharacterized protein
MKKTVLILSFFTLMLLAAGCQRDYNFQAVENSSPNISVQGEGMVEAVPDEAIVSFGVSSENKILSGAYKDNTKKINAVIATVKALGVESRDIKTSSYSITPVYPRDERGQQIPGGPLSFMVRQKLTVKVRDIATTGDLIDSVIAVGVNTFDGIGFYSSRIDDLESAAMGKAARDARKKAVLIAETLGVEIGKVLKVTESSAGPYPPVRMANYEARTMSAAPLIEAGSMEVKATCNVVYEIIQQ